MSLAVYFTLSLFLLGIDCIGLTSWQVFTGDFTVMPAMLLGAKLTLDGIFVFSNIGRIELKWAEVYFSSWIILASLLGLAHLLTGSDQFNFWRILKDTIPALFFFMKIAICRSYLEKWEFPIKKLVFWSLFLSLANIAIFYGLNGPDFMYVGLTPPINQVVAGSVFYSSTGLFIVSIIVIYFSGKRSYLIAVGIVIILLYIMRLQNKQLISNKFINYLLTATIFAILLSLVYQGAIVDKLLISLNSLSIIYDAAIGVAQSSSHNENISELETYNALYVATAGRWAEVHEIIKSMSLLDWIFGHGAGFTYQLELLDGTVLESYANSHFSPLSLSYKYGVIFAILFYIWIAKKTFFCPDLDSRKLFWVLIIVLLLIQSCFAFNLFVEFLLPVALAAIQSNSRKA
jgi:hypothetical protein